MRTTPSYSLPLLRVGASGNLTLNKTIISGATDTEPPGSYGFGGIDNDGGTLRLTDSSIVDTGGDAPGLYNRGGKVSLLRSTVSGSSRNNWFGYGGIVNGGGGTVALINSTVAGNGAGFSGGGISNQPDSTVTLTDSIVSGNRLYEGFGGGINNGGTLTLVRSTVTANSGTFGGGISNSETGVATLIRSTISNNGASGYSEAYGGAIANRGTLKLHNSTLSGNRAIYGGGLFNRGTIVVSNSTVTGNIGRAEGGGLFMSAGKVTLRRSLISGNTTQPSRYIPAPGPEINNLNNNLGQGGGGGVVVAGDFNLIGHDGDPGTVGFSPGPTDITPNDPVSAILLPLADNGGGTQTHALAIGSPALDASPDDVTCPTTDQRGNPRPRGPACDIGAFEGVAVLCNGKVTTMVGTINDDQLTGTTGPDVISGLLGNDTVYGLEGNDVVCAGSGNDVLYGGPGADLVFGEPGDDRLLGQGGNDTLNGGVGKDHAMADRG